jgi:hypothetical protein
MKPSKFAAGLVALTLFAIVGSAAPAFAVTNAGAEPPRPYVAAFAPIFGSYGVPHSGTMQLLVRDGTITGTYTGTSVGPDMLDDRIVAVTGSVSASDGYVLLNIGGALSMRGTMTGDGTISGTATYHGRLYEFMAKPG